jgi:predicted phage tail protein
VVIGIAAGVFIVPVVAGAAPELVNGLLLLMLVGALLMNSSKWTPYLAQFGTAISAPPPKT